MNLKRIALAGGVALVMAVPAGVAVAATGSPSPSPSPSTSTSQPSTGPGSGYGYGPGYGRMMGGTGDPEDCPFYDSSDPAAAEQWREHQAQRQQMMQQAHRAWAATPTPSAS